MAGNRRGRIKEHLIGVHKNCGWITEHVLQMLALIKDENPNLSEAITGIGKVSDQLDELTQDLFGTI